MTSNESEVHVESAAPAAPCERVVDVRSAASALDFIRTTEGHLDELTGVLQRMRVLSIQSANGTYSETDRSAIQIEVDQLTDEIYRIAHQADFTKMRLLTDACAEADVEAADELGMTPVKINTPAWPANTPASWTLRTHVGANTNEALAVNIYAANIQHLVAGGLLPDDEGRDGAAMEGRVNVLTAIDANASTARIDGAIETVTGQRSNLGTFSNRLESAIRSALVRDTRDKLLTAIGSQAQHAADKHTGQASATLAELARSYALVTTTRSAGSGTGLVLYPEVGDELVLGFFEEGPRYPVILGAMHSPMRISKVTALTGEAAAAAKNMITGTSQADVAMLVVPAEAGGFEGAFSRASQADVSAAGTAADARDQLLAAIGTEAQTLAEQLPGQASAQLAELARAYALVAIEPAAFASRSGSHDLGADPSFPSSSSGARPNDVQLFP